ncbi:methyl-accepting chemotaxis protein [Oceanisphaera sp. W20_SRM_FM3]|uniref:methyl-accepting chemotaxis protein n=1 Tax=Oceanisphaera sp. W20_SRM_FM3 TaxID=3240267 RepID=UPI003F9C1852
MYKNLTLRSLIRLIFLVVLSLALVLGLALYFLLQSQQNVGKAHQERFNYFNASNMMRMYSSELSTHIRNYVVTDNQEKLNAYREVLAITEGQAPRVNGLIISNEDMVSQMDLTSSEMTLLEQGRQATVTMTTLEKEALRLMAMGQKELAQQQVLGTEYDQARKTLSHSVDQFVSMLLARQSKSLQTQEARNHQMVVLMASLVVLLVVLSLLLGMILRRMVLQPLGAEPSEMERVAGSIADGDLSLNFAANSSGVYGKLQHMTEKLREVIGHIHQSSSSLSAAAEETSAVSLQTSANLSRQQQDTDQVAAAINEMAATVNEVSQNTSLAAASARSANDAAEQGKKVVQQTVVSISQLADDVISTGRVVQSLADSSTQISTVVQVIQDIADRTNLLALNAAIEAARAGEQGRGFAVVADEVRQLAGQTQKSSQEIVTMIAKLQGDAEQALKAMDHGRKQAELTVGQAQEAERALELISAAVQTINDMNTQIATAVEEQATVTEDISRNLTLIQGVGEETATGAEQTASASRELSELAAGLQQLVQGFRLESIKRAHY